MNRRIKVDATPQ